MNNENINRLKKYLFLISMVFLFLLWWHIVYVYLYDWALETPTEWWSISEWIIWDFPHLNPLLISNDYNKNIIYMLYRWLLKYDFEKDEIVWDLANCNLKNISYIECYLKDNIYWSNWEKITPEDIIATYNILKNSDINNTLWSLIKDTTIENRAWVIIFSSKVKDINFLTALFQPIVAKNVLDNIWNKELYGKFNPIDGLYSGAYKIDTVSYDDSLWIQKLILAKNEHYKEKEILVSKYIYKIFKDSNHLLKHKELINVFFDKNRLIWDTIPRLSKNNYFYNQYNSLFINEERIKSLQLRNFILWKIDVNNILKSLWKWYKEVWSIFLNPETSLNFEIKNSNIENIMKDIWYFKKDFLANMLVEENKQDIESKKINNEELKFITSPINKKYNFLNEDNVLIEWKIDWENPDEIYINEYKLSLYKKWDKNFYYRLRTDFKNYFAWENSYKVYFVKNQEKKFVEEFIITYSSDKEKLSKLEQDFNQKLEQSNSSSWLTISEDKKQKILWLNDKYYYDKDLNKLTFRLYYIENKEDHVLVVNVIKNILESYWIWVEWLPISISDLNKKILSWEKDYDMIIVWIDLWYLKFNIYPYFHSSQSKEWYSFSNIKNLNLDIILEELKSNILSKEKIAELQVKIKEILNEKQITRPLYVKENIVLIDNNIKKFKMKNNLSNDLAVIESIFNSYVTSEKTVDFSQKNFWDFINFIKKHF